MQHFRVSSVATVNDSAPVWIFCAHVCALLSYILAKCGFGESGFYFLEGAASLLLFL